MQSSVTVRTGTLLWIGQRGGREFSASYDLCENSASQIAWRPDVESALDRLASDVRCVVFAQSNRLAYSHLGFDRLAEAYPNATRLNVLGSMCEGICRTPEPYFGKNRHYWHRSNQVLHEFLSHWLASDTADTQPQRSVCIVASDFANAETLLELADFAGVTAVWTRIAGAIPIRNIDAVWWDDSFAKPTTSRVWSQRLARFASPKRRVRHAWIASSPRSVELQHAEAGGVHLVVSKPCRIDPLLEMLGGGEFQHAFASSALRVA